MGFGRKIGRTFLKLAEEADKIDEGLNELLGENRTKPGEGFSKERTAKKTAAIIQGNRKKDSLSISSKKSKDRKFF
jgi:hypothetical protein